MKHTMKRNLETPKRKNYTQCPSGPIRRSDKRLEEALGLMRNIVSHPLGKDLKRDNEIRAAWSGE